MKHKTEDYKLSTVNYYNNNDDGYDKTCKIFGCKKSSLKRWIQQYKTRKNLPYFLHIILFCFLYFL